MSAPALTRQAAKAAAFPCPSWCEGDCDHGWFDEEGSRYHSSGYEALSVKAHGRPQVHLSTCLTRLDDPDADAAGPVEIHLGDIMYDYVFTPAQARTMAAMFLNAADLAEPLPVRVAHISAEKIRIGDEIDTPDGWQTAYMILVDVRDQHVSIFTSERDDSYTDGWQYTFGDPLIIRRARAHRARRREVRR